MSNEIRVGTCGVIIDKEGKIFLQLRGKTARNSKDCWALPGGGVDYGETNSEGLDRELFEEIGIKVTNKTLFTTSDEFFPDQQWFNTAYVIHSYEGEITNMEPDKFDEIGFFDVTELPDNVCKYTAKIIIAFSDWIEQYLKYKGI